ncbi:CPBP family intramembrane glutamic endopeptidase [Metabacillus sp. RGM 3146]|uniref:CPBP family intramembrane glutamic endopeptidase n=1 Tax=Metabacillus sp. RGM 3146 TaxID=3401092 RepID=UPI003B9CB455
MKKQYWLILLTYVLMQLSGLVGPFLLLSIGVGGGQPRHAAGQIASGYWAVFSFLAALIITILLIRADKGEAELRGKPASPSLSAFWAVCGIFLALFAQSIAGMIETYVLHIKPGSENTKTIVEFISYTPLLVIVVAIVGPILEEIVFRKIIFGSLYKRTNNFFIAALISSLIFALVHFEPVHVLLYSAMGFTFAFLYVRTKRIIVPMIAHMSMNTLVILVNFGLKDQIEQLNHQMQLIIGGL